MPSVQSFGLILFSNVKIPTGKLLLTSGRAFISHRKIYLQTITALIKNLTLLLAQTMANQIQRIGRGTECNPLEPGSKLLSSISRFPSITEHRAARDLKDLSSQSFHSQAVKLFLNLDCCFFNLSLYSTAALEVPLFLQAISHHVYLHIALKKWDFIFSLLLSDLNLLCGFTCLVCPWSRSQSVMSLLVFRLPKRRWEGVALLRCGRISDPWQTNWVHPITALQVGCGVTLAGPSLNFAGALVVLHLWPHRTVLIKLTISQDCCLRMVIVAPGGLTFWC